MRKQNDQTHRQKTGKIGVFQFLFVAVMMAGLMIPSTALTKDWGQIMVAPAKTDIRAARTADSKLKGSLDAGGKVKADFLKDDWYAIFPLDRQERLEARALGYVHATRLKNVDAIPAAATDEEQIVVGGIRVIPGKGDRETVFIALNRFAAPRLFPIKGKNARLVIDFSNVSSVANGLTKTEVNSDLILRIRSSLDPRKHSFRVVLDLNTEKDLVVREKFYEAEKLYALELSEDKTTEVR